MRRHRLLHIVKDTRESMNVTLPLSSCKCVPTIQNMPQRGLDEHHFHSQGLCTIKASRVATARAVPENPDPILLTTPDPISFGVAPGVAVERQSVGGAWRR
jgi:hypothetical protein